MARIGIIYDRFGDAPPPPGAPPDWDAEYEPEATIAALEEALRALGHEPVRIGNVPSLLKKMGEGPLAIDAAINVAESYGSRNREAHAPVLLELAGIPHIGSDGLCLSLTLDKHLTKVVARSAGVATPDWQVLPVGKELEDDLPPFPVFVKPRYEGTAKGIAPSSRCDSVAALRPEVLRQHRLYGQDLILERFVGGPEYTAAVIGGAGPDYRPEVLPVLQRALERETRIGIHALERHEDPATPFDYMVPGSLDEELEAEIQHLCIALFTLFECQDFARLDFRRDFDGEVQFLEINPLPTFAPDGTFAIIAELAGRSYPEFLSEVIDRALRRRQIGIRLD